MPELPEVETIVRELRRKLTGRKIRDVKIKLPTVIKPQSSQYFRKNLIGQTIKDVARRGKLIIIELPRRRFLLIHLKLTGQLIFGEAPHKHTHVIFQIGRATLNYNDLRKFGFLLLTDKAGLQDILIRRFKFGPEPLTKDFTPVYLAKSLAGRGAPIKALLLDQTILAGLGNIYVDESLFRAGIHPKRAAKTLKRAEVEKLFKAIRSVLKQAIARGGSSSQNYVRTSGRAGRFQNLHNVYRRHGHPCPVCGGEIKRIVLAGRGTHFCPKCQT